MVAAGIQTKGWCYYFEEHRVQEIRIGPDEVVTIAVLSPGEPLPRPDLLSLSIRERSDMQRRFLRRLVWWRPVKSWTVLAATGGLDNPLHGARETLLQETFVDRSSANVRALDLAFSLAEEAYIQPNPQEMPWRLDLPPLAWWISFASVGALLSLAYIAISGGNSGGFSGQAVLTLSLTAVGIGAAGLATGRLAWLHRMRRIGTARYGRGKPTAERRPVT